MDLLGGYNSDSDDGSDASSLVVNDKNTNTATSTAEIVKATQYTNPAPRIPMKTGESETKVDKKKRVVGKKLLKLSAVLPEHILKQLQLSGGGAINDDIGDYSDDNGNDSSDDDIGVNAKASTGRKTESSIGTSSFSRDYPGDEGLIGLLDELSRSKTSRSGGKSTKFLNNGEGSSSPNKSTDDSTATPLSMPSTKTLKPQEVATNEKLGAAFLSTTIQTTKRKRKDPMAVRSIHESSDQSQVNKRNEEPSFFESESSDCNRMQSATSIHRSYQSSTSAIVPAQRIKATASLRVAAPPIRISSATSASDNINRNAPVVSGVMDTSYEHMDQKDKISLGGRRHPNKKKPLSRKRQMEQMLRAGKLNEVEGDHEVRGVPRVYNQGGDYVGSAASSFHGVGVRVVPTGAYDASVGATAMSTDVTSRQKTTNQLNSLLANAASLESQRAQNPQLQFMTGKQKAGSHRATAKRKYGW